MAYFFMSDTNCSRNFSAALEKTLSRFQMNRQLASIGGMNGLKHILLSPVTFISLSMQMQYI